MPRFSLNRQKCWRAALIIGIVALTRTRPKIVDLAHKTKWSFFPMTADKNCDLDLSSPLITWSRYVAADYLPAYASGNYALIGARWQTIILPPEIDRWCPSASLNVVTYGSLWSVASLGGEKDNGWWRNALIWIMKLMPSLRAMTNC